ncbi:MAG TPA: hypothetical protein VE992_00405 [Solirubrobacteraceae bacterium]|nr:hypothetical protein [Solirubrobacteraceae bacterium]
MSRDRVLAADPVRAIAQAVLYEGYLLWPYRRSALKNQQRFSFGGVYPRAFAAAGAERAEIEMEVVLEACAGTSVEVTLRCLQLVARRPYRRGPSGWEAVDEVAVDGERHVAWEEATEREFALGPLGVEELCAGRRMAIEVPEGRAVEAVARDVELVRSWHALEGELELSATALGADLLRVRAHLRNVSGWAGHERSEALARAFLSAHFIARARGGAFVSATDPPAPLAAAAGACHNAGVWPVLVGDPGGRELVLGSPIILSDHPSVAPESPGDLFDGGEIDALLIHSIRALTDAEREEIRATDPRAREILERSLAVSPEQMLALYGAVREMRVVDP